MAEDFYTILGVSKDDDAATIKKAYRQIARENHPDLNPDNKEAEEKFKAASVAFEVLSDPEKRKLYDEFGVDGLREGFNAEQARQYGRWQNSQGNWQGRTYARSGGYDDLFESIFGGRSPFDTSDYSNFGGFYTGPMKGQDLEAKLKLDFMTAIKGGELDITVNGKGIKVRIPAGIEDQERLRLKGKGGAAPGGAGTKPGDLLLTVEVQPHAILHRDGLNLSLDIPITMAEAVKGAKIAVPTPHGEYNVTVPSGVNSGAKLRLKEKGVHRGSKKGDFYAVIQIQAPDRIDDELLEAVEALSAGYTTDIRADLKLE